MVGKVWPARCIQVGKLWHVLEIRWGAWNGIGGDCKMCECGATTYMERDLHSDCKPRPQG